MAASVSMQETVSARWEGSDYVSRAAVLVGDEEEEVATGLR